MASKEKTREELSVRGLDTGLMDVACKTILQLSSWIIFRLCSVLLPFSVFELTPV